MSIEQELQSRFRNEHHKALVNLLYTNSWLYSEQSRLFKRFGLTMPQYNVLRILRGQHPNPATVRLIIERMMDKMSNASRIVDKLVSKGLVERRECSHDRRAVDVLITEEGLGMLREIDQHVEAWETCFHRHMSEEDMTTLNRLLDQLREAKG